MVQRGKFDLGPEKSSHRTNFKQKSAMVMSDTPGNVHSCFIVSVDADDVAAVDLSTPLASSVHKEVFIAKVSLPNYEVLKLHKSYKKQSCFLISKCSINLIFGSMRNNETALAIF